MKRKKKERKKKAFNGWIELQSSTSGTWCICLGRDTDWVCPQSFTALMQRKINRPLMKLLNHKSVRTADQRLRSSQAWLEAFWNQPREVLEPSHFRLPIYCTTDLGLSTILSLNGPLTCWLLSSTMLLWREFFKRQFNHVFCLTPTDLMRVCLCMCVCSPQC